MAENPNTDVNNPTDDEDKKDNTPGEVGDGEDKEQGAIAGGMFDFQNIMNDFYDYKPKKDDDEGRMFKNTFQANMIQSAFDAEMAKGLGQYNSALAQDNMTQQANLELRNQQANMQEEFNYGMQSMDAQFNYQNDFADNQVERDTAFLSATGEQQRKNIGAQGTEDRLGEITKGEQDRLAIGTQGAEDRQNITTQGSVDIDKIKAQGGEDRESMREEQRLKAKERAGMSKISRDVARSF